MFADAHLHMTDPGFGSGYRDICNAKLLFSNTARPSEYMQLSKIEENDSRVIAFYGTHPWYADEYVPDALEKIIKSNPRANIGEIGLDSKKGSIEMQLPAFLSQLEMASRYGRIASIHMVGCENEILNAVKKYRTKTILHSFSGPASYIKPLAESGCFFSISPRIFMKSPEKATSIISAIPKNRILLETDSPNGRGNSIAMSEHAENVGNAVGMEADAIMDVALANALILAGRMKRNDISLFTLSAYQHT